MKKVLPIVVLSLTLLSYVPFASAEGRKLVAVVEILASAEDEDRDDGILILDDGKTEAVVLDGGGNPVECALRCTGHGVRVGCAVFEAVQEEVGILPAVIISTPVTVVTGTVGLAGDIVCAPFRLLGIF